jgi:excisionase family DNA binding protein
LLKKVQSDPSEEIKTPQIEFSEDVFSPTWPSAVLAGILAEVREIEPMLTSKEVMEVLKITNSTLYRLIDQGVLKKVKIGRNVRFRAEDIRRFTG